ncbi:MAG: FecR domain-containing protein [Deltaproteobacteria bacterium]|nr:FecR domain-containing protein [Deltaproteobacteria bacterium]
MKPEQTELPNPIHQTLTQPDAASVDRVWRRVKARRNQPNLGMAVRVGWAVAGAALAAAILLTIRPASRELEVAELASGGAILEPLARAHAMTETRFADGSSLVASPGTSLELLVNDGRELSFLLEKGSIDVEVTPGGPRRWVFETALARVEVLGTHFRIDSTTTSFRLEVSRGAVLVRSDSLEARVARVHRGEILSLAPPRPSPTATVSAAETTRPTGLVSRSIPPDRSAGRAKSAVAVEANVVAIDAGLAPTGTTEPIVSAVDSLERAGELEKKGRGGEAAAMFTRLSSADDRATAALAAFELGRLEQERGDARQAVEAFERALELGLPNALRESTYARLIRACQESGQLERAERWKARVRVR